MLSEEADRLLTLLRRNIESMTVEGRTAVLYSGGLDSTVIARLCSEFSVVTLYTTGVEGSHDILAASSGAAELGLELRTVIADESDVFGAASDVDRLFSEELQIESDHLAISIYAPMFLLMGHVREELLFSGQGADELFGGYHRYLSMDDRQREAAMQTDVAQLLEKGIRRDRCIAAHFGKRLNLPFLSGDVIDFAASLDPSFKVSGGVRKRVLRECASRLSLSAASAGKKAMQYGSGFEKVIRKRGSQRVR